MNWNKVGIILLREYTVRVRSRGFLVGTLLGPLGLLLILVVPVLVTLWTQDTSRRRLAVLDATGRLGPELVSRDTARYYVSHEPESALREAVRSGRVDGYLLLPPDVLQGGRAHLYTRGGGGLAFRERLEADVSEVVRLERLRQAGLDTSVIRLARERVPLETHRITETGVERDQGLILAGLGYVLGFLIYVMMLIYGALVMRGVIEEKTNRIIEVLASSARPFEIMMGKVLGIGAVGLTQILIWILLGMGILVGLGPFWAALMSVFGANTGQEATALPVGLAPSGIPASLLMAFVFYFLAGYFLYATLFAAIGSAVDQESDAQNLQWPITLPIIVPIFFITNVIADPDGVLAVVLSLVPFFAPILMVVRLAATTVPLWQVGLSVLLLALAFWAGVWISARIYRVGILIYGKKPTLREILRWARQG
ncbi:MAG: ABC transporter permease [Bacteroidetes bacterium]|nr:ABC transporter permease [Rhodothermia bacterium]MCS7154508.1 ABC transporter permease [Bacteroidota bacterium]MCX7906881.1 ABC transporter permease [Bacteroidota bacterium]MDW8136840.1 ABC transporter permease [Bacteroidota bacterium]MDW8285290.1 ABC transporter permease [Bacteroidota bacterium]